jgi:hypothetical protein
MIDIVCADRSMLGFLLQHLRAPDATELGAAGANFGQMPHEIMRLRVFAFCACSNVHGPIAAWGMLQARPGVGAGFAFGTDRWGDALLPMVRQIRSFVLPHLREAGFHRVEAVALASRRDVAQFMALIGAQPETVLRGFGVGGEDFVQYRWLDEHGRETCRASPVLHAHTTH